VASAQKLALQRARLKNDVDPAKPVQNLSKTNWRVKTEIAAPPRNSESQTRTYD